MTAETLKEFHTTESVKARELYLNQINPLEDAEVWHLALREAGKLITAALRASNNLRNLEQALVANGGHMLVFRHLIAPPLSQDQFQLRCPEWPKSSEKDERPVSLEKALKVASSFALWRNKHLTPWLDRDGIPSRAQLKEILLSVSPLIAGQRVATLQRNRYAAQQEKAVIDLLLQDDWAQLPSLLIDKRAALPRKSFMHKTRFATASVTPQEVDIACGLKNTGVAAIECKVTNDQTNSVKRINDVIKKAEAWRTHWGSFVITTAILQGVIASKDVARLIDHNIQVFWSHDLDRFKAWLDTQL